MWVLIKCSLGEKHRISCHGSLITTISPPVRANIKAEDTRPGHVGTVNCVRYMNAFLGFFVSLLSVFAFPCSSLTSSHHPCPDSELNHREFQREAQILKSLRHRHLISLFAVCTASPPYYIITELMEKGSLLHFLRGKPLSPCPSAPVFCENRGVYVVSLLEKAWFSVPSYDTKISICFQFGSHFFPFSTRDVETWRNCTQLPVY